MQTVQAVRSIVLYVYAYSDYYIKYRYNQLKHDITFTKRSNVVWIQFDNTGEKKNSPKGRETLLANRVFK